MDIVFLHASKEGNGAANVDAIVFEGNHTRLSNSLQQFLSIEPRLGLRKETYLESSKVNHAVNLGMGGKDLLESGLIGDIDLVKVGSFTAQELDAIQTDFGGVVETVDNDDLVAVL